MSLWHQMAHWFRSGPAPAGQMSVVYEVTTRCNLSCRYCYNVWNPRPGRAAERDDATGPAEVRCSTDGTAGSSAPYPHDELDTEGALRLIERIHEQTRCLLLTFTGGEPLLRPDLEVLVRHARSLGMGCNLITNGTLMTP